MSHALRSHTWRRAAGLVAASTLALTVVAPSATAAPPTTGKTDDGAITVAGSWLKGELTDGLVDAGGFTDFGLTLDTGFAPASGANGKQRVHPAQQKAERRGHEECTIHKSA